AAMCDREPQRLVEFTGPQCFAELGRQFTRAAPARFHDQWAIPVSCHRCPFNAARALGVNAAERSR
ncbi:hypothetical protein, partial [Amycolatopsis sp. NPDC000740]|uniref:hypothetical protein n=1 Tax=Amycolatopsis sp. NPDC000740 TaxID=3154269 RepID=UPI00331BF284